MKNTFKYILCSLLMLSIALSGCGDENPNEDLGTQVTEVDNSSTPPSPGNNEEK